MGDDLKSFGRGFTVLERKLVEEEKVLEGEVLAAERVLEDDLRAAEKLLEKVSAGEEVGQQGGGPRAL